jgi:hypothetical protein
MLQRYANFLCLLVLGLDVLCLISACAVADLFGWDTGRAVLLFERWNMVPIALLRVFPAWLFRFYYGPVLFRRWPAVQDLVAANSSFVGLAFGPGSLLADPPTLSTIPVSWVVGLSARASSLLIALSALCVATEWCFNRRRVLIRETGTLAQDLVRRLHAMPEYTCIVRGYLSVSPGEPAWKP